MDDIIATCLNKTTKKQDAIFKMRNDPMCSITFRSTEFLTLYHHDFLCSAKTQDQHGGAGGAGSAASRTVTERPGAELRDTYT